VGVYLPEPVFAHGQLYVALSRGISYATMWVLAKRTKTFKERHPHCSQSSIRRPDLFT
jgi:hypothetical protein